MILNAAGIRKGWQTEDMPFPRVMGDAILTLDGNVLIVNGAQTGVAGCVLSFLDAPLLPSLPSLCPPSPSRLFRSSFRLSSPALLSLVPPSARPARSSR